MAKNRPVGKYSGARDWNSSAGRFHRHEVIEPTWEPSEEPDRIYFALSEIERTLNFGVNQGGTAETNPIPSLL